MVAASAVETLVGGRILQPRISIPGANDRRPWSDAAALLVLSTLAIDPLFDSHMASCWRYFEGWYKDGPRVYTMKEETFSMVRLLSCSDELRGVVDDASPLPPGMWLIGDHCRGETATALPVRPQRGIPSDDPQMHDMPCVVPWSC